MNIGIFMPNTPLGPKTGTFEPPHENKYLPKDRSLNPSLWDTVKKMHEEIGKSDKAYENLYALTNELINAYVRNDKEDIDRLIKEFRELP
jgi:hypothetical protein